MAENHGGGGGRRVLGLMSDTTIGVISEHGFVKNVHFAGVIDFELVSVHH